jgi:plastocyanin
MSGMPTRRAALSGLALFGSALVLWAMGASAQPAATIVIDEGLEPAVLEIAPGTSVTWQNADDERHRVRSREGPVTFDSGDLEPGETFTFTFGAEGSYPYQDARDEEVAAYQGTIIVATPADQDTRLADGASVAIVDRAYRPSGVTVSAGSTVEWTNADSEAHTVTSTDGLFDSGIMGDGVSHSQTFETPGTYAYRCAIHPEMRGSVTVVAVADPGGPAATPLPSASPSAAPPASPDRAVVTIAQTAYGPASLEVAAGTTVHWTNDDPIIHTVTARDGSFNSGVLQPGDEYSFAFEASGTYEYFCAVHPGQGGSIVVSDVPG